MSFESEIFKKWRPNPKRLIQYGFVKDQNMYQYSQLFLDNTFRADITVDHHAKVQGKVIEIELDEEYVNFRSEAQIGEFVGKVRKEYQALLEDIREKCFEKQYFITAQANRITKLIQEQYGDTPEFLWEKFSGYGVFRNPQSQKWYGLIMNIDKRKIENGTGEVEILNLKLNEELVKNLLTENGFYPSYHMKKADWITILLDDTIDDKRIMELLEISHGNSMKRSKSK